MSSTCGECHFGLDHPEFGEMTPCLGFFGPKRRPEVVHLSQSHRRGFAVELARLGQERLVLEVIDRKQCRRSLTGCRGQDRRVAQREPIVVQEFSRGPDNLVSNLKDGTLPAGPDPQMAFVHQEFNAMLLGRDRKLVIGRDDLKRFDRLHVHLASAGRAFVRADRAGDGERRLMCQVACCREGFFRHRFLEDHGLQISRSITNDKKA